MKKVNLTRRWLFSTIFALLFAIFLIFTTNITIINNQLKSIESDVTNRYLEAKIESISTSTKAFINSFDSIVKDNIYTLNETSNYFTHLYFSNLSYSFFNVSFLNVTKDTFFYLKGTITAYVKRTLNIGYLDFYHDNSNALDTPGAVFFGDVIDKLTLNGGVYLQINASIEGPLSSNGTIYIYYIDQENGLNKFDITSLYSTLYHNSFSDSILNEWNTNYFSIPQAIKEKLNISEEEHSLRSLFKTYFLILDSNANNITVLKNTSKSRIEGCVKGSISGNYSGIVKGNINGSLAGYIDFRPLYIYNAFPSFLNVYLQWVYFASPDYFIIYPYAPNFLSEHSIALSASFDWLKRPWYNEIMSQENNSSKKGISPYFSKPDIDYVFGNLFISLGRAIYNGSMDYQGLLVLDFNLNYLKHALELNITPKDFNWLVSKDGDIIYNPEYFVSNSTKQKPFEIVNIATYNSSLISQCFNNGTNGLSGNIIGEFNQTSYIIYYSSMESINWVIFHFSPVDLVLDDVQPIVIALYKHLRSVELFILLFSVFSVLIVGIADILITSRIHKYISQLRSAINSVSEGDYSNLAFNNDEKTINEITELFYQFEDMALKLDESITKERESAIFARMALDLFIHDVGNYMHIVKGYVSLLEKIVPDKKVSELCEKINAVINRSEHLRKKIIAIRKLDRRLVEGSKVKLLGIITKAIAEVRTVYPHIKLEAAINVPDDLYFKDCEHIYVLFESLIEFYVNNAKGKTISLVISARLVDENSKKYIKIEFEDENRSISEQRKAQIITEILTGKRVSDFNIVVVSFILKYCMGNITVEKTDKNSAVTESSKIIIDLYDIN